MPLSVAVSIALYAPTILLAAMRSGGSSSDHIVSHPMTSGSVVAVLTAMLSA